MADLKVGSVVKLKSGGPYMTVTDLNGRGGVACTWFDKDKVEVKGYTFPTDALAEVQLKESHL